MSARSTPSARARVIPAPLERHIQRAVVALYQTAGCRVYSTSQGYRPGGRRHGTTRIALGFPDLVILHPGFGVAFHECKRPHAKQTLKQMLFQSECQAAGVRYVLGGAKDALDFLVARGLWKLPRQVG